MPCSQTRFRHSCTVGRLTPSSSAIDTLSWPARAPKIIRQRSATCCGVPYEDSHFSSCVRSAGCNLIARLVFGMSEIIAIARKSVKLFKGHYTRVRRTQLGGKFVPKVRTHYDNLKIARDAPIEVIRAAYRSLSQKYHPDHNPGDPNAGRIMKILNSSYEVLSDPALRSRHDHWILQAESEPAGPSTTTDAPRA